MQQTFFQYHRAFKPLPKPVFLPSFCDTVAKAISSFPPRSGNPSRISIPSVPSPALPAFPDARKHLRGLAGIFTGGQAISLQHATSELERDAGGYEITALEKTY